MHDFGEKCPRHFPGKFSRNFRNFRNFPKFPRNFPGIFPDFPRFFNDEKHDFRSVSLCFTSKTPWFSGNFPGIFRKFSGKIFANFRNFGNFPEISPGIFPDFPPFYKHKKSDFCSVTLHFTEKNTRNFREIFRGNFFREFLTFRKFSPKFSRNFSLFEIFNRLLI